MAPGRPPRETRTLEVRLSSPPLSRLANNTTGQRHCRQPILLLAPSFPLPLSRPRPANGAGRGAAEVSRPPELVKPVSVCTGTSIPTPGTEVMRREGGNTSGASGRTRGGVAPREGRGSLDRSSSPPILLLLSSPTRKSSSRRTSILRPSRTIATPTPLPHTSLSIAPPQSQSLPPNTVPPYTIQYPLLSTGAPYSTTQCASLPPRPPPQVRGGR